MFTGSPFTDFAQRPRTTTVRSVGMSWLLMLPGVLLTLMALAILLWPELLAYMVAGAMLFGGLSLITWGWTMRRLTNNSSQRSTVVHYEVR
jgi:hypothetical protein